MTDDRVLFQTRLNRLARRHSAMARGYSASVRSDGLIVVQPRRFQFKLPVRGFVLLMTVFMLFKGFMLASLGDATYQNRLAVLERGTLYEQAGAFVMGIDPVSAELAALMRPIIR